MQADSNRIKHTKCRKNYSPSRRRYCSLYLSSNFRCVLPSLRNKKFSVCACQLLFSTRTDSVCFSVGGDTEKYAYSIQKFYARINSLSATTNITLTHSQLFDSSTCALCAIASKRERESFDGALASVIM